MPRCDERLSLTISGMATCSVAYGNFRTKLICFNHILECGGKAFHTLTIFGEKKSNLYYVNEAILNALHK